MADEEPETLTKAYIYVGFLLLVAISTPLCRLVPATCGDKLISHIAFGIVAALTLLFVPAFIQNELFSPAGIIVIGTLMPIYESIYAICTPGEDDDAHWLQFWVVNAVFTYSFEFMDIIADRFPTVGEHWFEFEFFVTLWLVLPFTNGSELIFKHVTEPYIGPSIKKMKKSLEGWGGMLAAAVNASNLGFVWFAFTMLPEEARRFVVVAVGTVYPIIASMVAISTTSTGMDDTQWLTYWSCFNILFIIMDYLENFVGSITGFYSLCLVATVYLYLPMFNGAEVVFRNVLVPLTGQYESMLLHDAYLLRSGVEKSLTKEMQAEFLPKMVGVFTKKKD